MNKPEENASVGNPVERLVRRFRLAGSYSIIDVGEYFAVKKHGYFYDSLVNLRAPYLTHPLSGDAYFNQALGARPEAERIYKRLNGVEAYSA